MKILVLNGSPRLNGNTAALCEAFCEGARQAGHETETLNVGKMKIGACLACEYCHGKGAGKCVQNDDMNKIYEALETADMVVIASAVHYWSFTGQMQSAITRFYAPHKLKQKKYALILSSGSPDVYDAPISQFESIVNYFGGKAEGEFTFNGFDQKNEKNFERLGNFGRSLK